MSRSSTDYKLTVDSDGKLAGKANITYNNPWPCNNGTPGGGANSMNGVVMHTMVTDLPQCINWFNNPNAQASAFFGIAQDGTIHQFGPVGQNWMAWAQMNGNPNWYSIEHADHGNPDNPLTQAQMFASAQIVECLSAFAGFPLQEANTVDEKGYGVHYMGGAAWGGHSCPDVPPSHVRSHQRPEILKLAEQIRNPVEPVTFHLVDYTSDGTLTFNQILTKFGNAAGYVLYRTFTKYAEQAELLDYVSNLWFDAVVPSGIVLVLREKVVA